MVNIQVLYFQGCPNHVPTVALVREVVSELGLKADIEEIEVTSPEEAHRRRFLGSPTVHVNGIDIDPSAASRTAYSESCRMYNGSGVPPRAYLVTACQAAQS